MRGKALQFNSMPPKESDQKGEGHTLFPDSTCSREWSPVVLQWNRLRTDSCYKELAHILHLLTETPLFPYHVSAPYCMCGDGDCSPEERTLLFQ